jgi:hypothetical protein
MPAADFQSLPPKPPAVDHAWPIFGSVRCSHASYHNAIETILAAIGFNLYIVLFFFPNSLQFGDYVEGREMIPFLLKINDPGENCCIYFGLH